MMDSHAGPTRAHLPSGQDAAAQLWQRFAAAILDEAPASIPPEHERDPAALAAAFERTPPDALYDPRAAILLGETLAAVGSDRISGEPVTAAITGFLDAVSLPGLRRLLGSVSVAQRREVIYEAIALLPPRLLIRLLAVAGETGETPASPAALSLLGALAERAPASPAADEALRRQARALVSAWLVTAPARGDAAFAVDHAQPAAVRAEAVRIEPERVIQTAIEIPVAGPALWGPVKELLDAQRTPELLAMMKAGGAGNHAVTELAHALATPARVRQLLDEEVVDFEAADLLLNEIGLGAARILIDKLVESPSRVTRRGILDRLGAMGPALGPILVERLNDPRWFVQRNMLGLLRETKYPLDKVPLEAFMRHGDPRVRREALQLRMKHEPGRAEALRLALEDGDPHTVRLGLLAARDDCPPAILPVLVKRLADPTFPSFLRVPALRLFHGARNVVALEALLRIAGGPRRLFGGARLAPKTPEMLAALGVLADTWDGDKRAMELVELGRRSKDPEIRGAVAAGRHA
jgi:hypothetical protein